MQYLKKHSQAGRHTAEPFFTLTDVALRFLAVSAPAVASAAFLDLEVK